MTRWDVVRVELEPPVAGRAVLRVSRGAQVVEFPFSYTPRDSIELLAEAVDAVVAGPGERTVVFSSGPEELDLALAHGSAGRVDLRLSLYPDHRRDLPGQEQLSLVLNPRLAGKLFWRALRQLETKVAPAAYEQAWHHPFPTRLVAQLGARLEEECGAAEQ